MVREVTTTVEDVSGDGSYQRLYPKRDLVSDSTWPFRAGQTVRMQLVETTCERTALVVVPSVLEVDDAATELEITRRSDATDQGTLEDVEGEA